MKTDKKNLTYYLALLPNLLISLPLFMLSYIIPKDENLYLFGSGRGGVSFRGNPKFLYLHLIKNKSSCQIIWITKSKSIYNKLNKKGYPVLKSYSMVAFWKILRARYFIVDSSVRGICYIGCPFGNFNFIQTWHGTPLKKIWYPARKDFKGMEKKLLRISAIVDLKKKTRTFSCCKYKLIISPSENVSKILISSSLNKNVEITGYPRNDVFFNEDLIFENYREELSLDKYQRVILYCPTFRDNYNTVKPFSNNFLKKLDEYLGQINSVLLIKKHPYDKNIEMSKNLLNTKDISSKIDDLQDLLVFSDILISDYSSVFFDFVLLHRPMIFYSYDLEEYLRNCRSMNYDYYKDLVGPFAKSENELLELIKSVDRWFNDKSYQIKYKKFKNRFNYYQDGESCKRLLHLLKGKEQKK